MTPSPPARCLRILYMEDDAALAQLVRRRLGRQGMEVEIAPDGEVGLAKLAADSFDVAVVDYRLPTLDGLAVLRHLVANPTSPPAILVSGFSSLEIAIDALRLGAADYVVKETGNNYLELLAGTIERVLDKQHLLQDKLLAEASRQESELQLRSIADSASEAILSADEMGHIIFWNRGAETVFGYREEEVLGQSLTLLMPDHYRPLHNAALQRVNQTGQMQRLGQLLELTALRKGEIAFPMEISLSTWVVGNRRFFSAVGRDITARKQAEQQTRRLLQTQTLLNALLQSATGSRSLDEQLAVALRLILTGSWLTTLHKGAIFLRDDTTGDLVLKFQQGMEGPSRQVCDRVAAGHCLCGKVLETGQLLFADWLDPAHTIHYQGMQPHCHYCVPIISRGRLLGVMNIYMPPEHPRQPEEEEFLNTIANTLAGIIERKQLDEKLHQAILQAERANAEKSRFLAAMSHEIRTPMNAILGMGEMLAESCLDEEQGHYLQVINQAGQGLLALINDILDLSKIEAGQLELEVIPFDLRAILASMVNILQLKATSQSTTITTQVAESIPERLLGDPQRLQQVLLNLLSNAVKFTAGGQVLLSVTPAGENRLALTVADTGIGIPVERQATIFQPFIQAETSTSRRFGGTGLGLSICQKLVEKMAGTIRLESQPGRGSTFCVEIPCRPAAPRLETRRQDGETDQTIPAGTETGLSILLADDAEENRLLIAAFLKKTPHHLTMVEDGWQAVQAFQSGHFDCILMDVQMPGMDGYEATRTIRAWEQRHHRPPTPILALTANAMREDVEKSRAVGCTAHLSKPISKRQLLEALPTGMPQASAGENPGIGTAG
ncbi:MAG: response regulator [Magnetococcus sp. DMHC-8]